MRASGSEEASSEVSADADGRFTLPVLDGEPIVAIAEAEGFGRLLFTADALHGTPGEAAVIRLRRAASLQARVLAASGGGVAGVEVFVRCEAADLQNVDGQTANPFVLEDEVWRGRTDELGLALLEGLAPGAALHVELRAEGRTLLRSPDALHHLGRHARIERDDLNRGSVEDRKQIGGDPRPVPCTPVVIWVTALM